MISYDFAVRTGNLFQSQGDCVVSLEETGPALNGVEGVVGRSKGGHAGRPYKIYVKMKRIPLPRALTFTGDLRLR